MTARLWLLVVLTIGVAGPAVAQTETIEYYGTDAVGSVRIVFNASGTVLGRQDYDPFGREILSAWGVPPERFAGQTADSEVQQSYFHAREVQSRTGRFGVPDSVFDAIPDPQSWNRYVYALNSPVSVTDPNGRQAHIRSGTNGCADTPLSKDSPEYREACPAYVGASATDTMSQVVAAFFDDLFGTTPVGGPESELHPTSTRRPSSRIQTAIGAALLAASLISPMARASSAETAGTAAVGEVSAVKQAFHYTFSRFLPDIEEFGLRPGTYATTDGTLSPLQAQIDLALQPNIGVRDTLISIDLTALQDAGYHLPEITQVPVGYGMPGGGTQMQFPYRIPPTFLTVVRRW